MRRFTYAGYANGILVGSAVVFFLSYPFTDNTVIELINHISGAAMIGGLADWYAVTALFGKPFGIISYRANLVPKKVDLLKEMVVYMVAHELLTRKHIYRMIKKEKLPDKLCTYFFSGEGNTFLSELRLLAKDLTSKFPVHNAIQHLVALGRKGVNEWQAAPVLADLLREFLILGGALQLWSWLNRVLQKVVVLPIWTPYLVAFIQNSRKKYEEGGALRDLLQPLLTRGGDDDVKIAVQLQEKILVYLQEQQGPHSDMAQALQRGLANLTIRLETDQKLQDTLESFKIRLLHEKEGAFSQALAESLLFDKDYWLEYGEAKIKEYVWAIQNDSQKRQKLEELFLTLLAKGLKVLNPIVEKMVNERLAEYDGISLAALLKDKLGKDLQAIRINGSLMGALVGGLIGLLKIAVDVLSEVIRHV